MNGLNSYQYTVQNAGLHNCRIEVDHRAGSTMTISIVQAGSVNATIATVTLVPPANSLGPQNSTVLQACINAAVSDTVTFVLTSSAAIDTELNTVKSKLNVHLGGLN